VYNNGELQARYYYNANGLLTRRVLGNGVIVDYTHNLAGLVTSVTNSYGGEVLSRFEYEYYLDGNKRSVIEMTISPTQRAGSLIELISNAIGTTSATPTVTRVVTYEFDLTRRLVRESETWQGFGGTSTVHTVTRKYQFDERGNRILMVVKGSGIFEENFTYYTIYEYDLNNRLLTEVRTTTNTGALTTNIIETILYTYDANGNQLTRIKSTRRPSGAAVIINLFTPGNAPATPGNSPLMTATSRPRNEISTYNTLNQLVRVVTEHHTVEYQYKTNGMRRNKNVRGRGINDHEVIVHVWDGANIVLEMTAHRAVNNRYVRGIGLIYSEHHGFYLHNGRGDVIQRVSRDGDILHTYRYTAFGIELNPCDDNNNVWRFNGEYFDFETGRQYLRFRSYDPHIGRFTQEDPYWNINNMQDNVTHIMQSGNLYAFCMNNPIFWVDPWGLYACEYSFFNLIDDVRARGGTFVRFIGGAVRVNIFDVTTTFVPDSILNPNPGVQLYNDVLFVNGATFWSQIVNAAQEIIFLGGHGGVVPINPIYHLHVTMFVSRSSPYWDHPDFNYFEPIFGGNVRFAHLSGGASDEGIRALLGLSTAVSAVNRQNYLERSNLRFLNHLHTGRGMITNLFAAHVHFDTYHSTHFQYVLLPSGIGHNSTSITLSLLNAVGLNHGLTWGQRRLAIGMNMMIHPGFFGQF